MRRYVYILAIVALALTSLLCSCSDDGNGTGVSAPETETNEPVDTIACNIVVIMPMNNDYSKAEYERLINEVQTTMNSVAHNYDQAIKINVKEWLDEETADIETYMMEHYSDKDIDAFVGPCHAANVDVAAEVLQMGFGTKPLISPKCSSEEVMRKYADEKGFLWSMVETDVTQTNMLLQVASNYKAKTVSLLAKNDLYGQTFINWFGYFAHEKGLEVKKVLVYDDMEDLQGELDRLAEDEAEDLIVFALDALEEKRYVLQNLQEWEDGRKMLFTDSFYENEYYDELSNLQNGIEGVSFCASPSTLYAEKYYATNLERATWQPFFMDAAMMASLAKLMAVNMKTDNLNDMIRLFTNAELKDDLDNMTSSDIIKVSLHLAIAYSQNQGDKDYDNIIQIHGFSNMWSYDPKVYTTPTSSTYCHYNITGPEITPICYYTSDDRGEVSWSWVSILDYEEDSTEEVLSLPNDHWAVVVGCGTGWDSYRFQSDALAFYHLLKDLGYDDDHIVLIEEGDIAQNSKNPTPGVIVNSTIEDAENLWEDVQIDYHISDLTAQDLTDILLGNQSERVPEVIHSGKDDNITLFWVGHGDQREGLMLRDKVYWDQDVFKNIIDKVNAKGNYQALISIMDACFAGDICKNLDGKEDHMLFITSCMEGEYSHPAESKGSTWLSNAFSQKLLPYLYGGEHRDDGMSKVLVEIRKSVTGQHATVYNASRFYNLGRTSLWSYLILKQ